MAIAVTCTNCGVRLRFKSEHAGKTTKCRACGEPLIVQGQTIPDHDVFLSYSSKDKNVADAICAALEANHIRCWVAPRDILPGKVWAGAILDAIDDTRLMVLIYSSNSNNSPQVLREVDRAVSRSVIIVPFRIENTPLSKEMEYYISAAHWMDAMDGQLEAHIAALVGTIRRLMGSTSSPVAPRSRASQIENKRPWQTWLTASSICLSIIAITAIALFAWRMSRPQAPHLAAMATPKPMPVMIPATQPLAEVSDVHPGLQSTASTPNPNDRPVGKLHLRNGWNNILTDAISKLRSRNAANTADFVAGIFDSLNQPGGKTSDALAADQEQLNNRVHELISQGEMESAGAVHRAMVMMFLNSDFPSQPANPNHKVGGSPGPDGLVLYLPCNKPPVDGIVHDQSGAGNDGHVYGARWVPDPKFGGAYQFQIKDFTDRIVIPNSDTLNPQYITMSAWIKSTPSSGFWQRIIDKDFLHGYAMSLNGDWKPGDRGRPLFEHNRSAIEADTRADDNQWHHVAVVYDGEKSYCYLDGARTGSRAVAPGPMTPCGWDLCIGNSIVNYNRDELDAFDGLITQIRIYNRALPADEIEALRQSPNRSANPISLSTGSPDINAGLVLHFTFNKPAINGIVKDESGNGNDGKVAGATWINDGQRPGYKFNGDSGTDVIAVSDSPSLNLRRATVSAWIKTNRSDRWWRRIVDEDWRAAYDLTICGDTIRGFRGMRGKLGFEVNGRSIISDVKVADGRWHHVASTYDGHELILYVDGEPQTRIIPFTGPIGPNATSLRIGNGRPGGERSDGRPEILAFDGEISDVRIYNRALSQAGIIAIRNASSAH